MPYVETVHADGTPYMEPLTVYAPPRGTVLTSVLPGTAARPPVPTRYAFLPEADNAPLDNTAYKAAPLRGAEGPRTKNVWEKRGGGEKCVGETRGRSVRASASAEGKHQTSPLPTPPPSPPLISTAQRGALRA